MKHIISVFCGFFIAVGCATPSRNPQAVTENISDFCKQTDEVRKLLRGSNFDFNSVIDLRRFYFEFVDRNEMSGDSCLRTAGGADKAMARRLFLEMTSPKTSALLDQAKAKGSIGEVHFVNSISEANSGWSAYDSMKQFVQAKRVDEPLVIVNRSENILFGRAFDSDRSEWSERTLIVSIKTSPQELTQFLEMIVPRYAEPFQNIEKLKKSSSYFDSVHKTFRKKAEGYVFGDFYNGLGKRIFMPIEYSGYEKVAASLQKVESHMPKYFRINFVGSNNYLSDLFARGVDNPTPCSANRFEIFVTEINSNPADVTSKSVSLNVLKMMTRGMRSVTLYEYFVCNPELANSAEIERGLLRPQPTKGWNYNKTW